MFTLITECLQTWFDLTHFICKTSVLTLHCPLGVVHFPRPLKPTLRKAPVSSLRSWPPTHYPDQQGLHVCLLLGGRSGGVAWLLSERILGPTLPRPALTSHHHCKARFSRLLQVSFGIFFCNQRLFPIGQSIILQGLHSPGISYGRLVCQCNYKDMCWTFGTCGTMPWAFALEIFAVLPSGCGGLQNNFRF